MFPRHPRRTGSDPSWPTGRSGPTPGDQPRGGEFARPPSIALLVLTALALSPAAPLFVQSANGVGDGLRPRVATALAPTLAAQEPGRIDIRETIRSDARVEIRTIRHPIHVQVWDRDEIQITGSYDPDREEQSTRGSQTSFRFEIRSRRAGGWGRMDRADPVEVRVPRGVRLEAQSVSGSVDLAGVEGTVTAETVSGSIDISARSGDVRLQSVSGSIRFSGAARDLLRATSVSGRVVVEGEVGMMDLNTVSGGMELRTSTPLRSADLTSVSGTLDFAGPLAPNGSITAESHSGTVTLALPPDVDARFRLSSFSGRVESNLPGMTDEVFQEGRFTPDQSLSFTVGAGSGNVEARSFSGRVTVRPLGR
jgi:hypothetical protein